MGNLCSSGTDRTEKKEDTQLPKTKDGADEALLSKTGEGVEVADADEKKGEGLSGLVGGVTGAGEAALSDAVETAKDQGEKVVSEGKALAAEVVEKGKEAAVESKDAIVAGITGAASGAKDSAEQVAGKAKDAAVESKDAVVAGVSSAAAEVKDSAEQQASSAASEVKSKVESGQQRLSGLVDDVKTGAQSGVGDVKADASSALESGKEQTQSAVAGVADKAAAVKEEAFAAVETSKTEAANVVAGVKDEAATVESSVGESAQEPSSGLMDTVKENVQEVSASVKDTVVEKSQEAGQTAKDYLSQAVDTAKASAMGSFASASTAAAGAVDGAKETTSDAVTSVEESVEDAEKKVAAEIPSVPSDAGELQSAVSTSGVSGAMDALAGDMKSAEENVKDEAKKVIDDLPTPPPSPPVVSDVVPSLQSEKPEQPSGSGFFGNIGATATGAVTSGVEMVGEKIADKVEDLTGGQKEEQQPVMEAPVQAAQESSVETAPPAAEESSGLMSGIGASASGAIKTGFGVVSEKIEEKAKDLFGGEKESADETLQSDIKVEAAEEPITQSEGQPDVETMPPEEGDFIEKAKSLLEQHRNSVDGNKMANLEDSSVVRDIAVDETSQALSDLSNNNNTINNNDDNNNNNNNDVSEEVADKAREDTARDFVEGIIDRATSIVSDSMVSGDSAQQSTDNGAGAEDDSLSSPDPCVDHTEETIAPKKRGVCFASPQPSDQSLSSLSSPPEITSPPVTQDVDLSPPSEASSISQGELVERDIELELPSPPQSTTEESGPSPDEESPETTPTTPATTTTEDQGVLDNERIQGMEEADESLKRIAMEVTTKAVQDAIKIVTENGTGAGIANLNDLGVSSPSSAGGGDQEEEMTTTDSSQVERGSSVSDLTDTSQQGSIADSLSSYDPGAVYRQDAAAVETPAEASETPDATNATTAAATTSTINSTGESESVSQTATAIDDGKSVADTPTNQTSNADNQSQTDGSNGNNSTEPHAPSPTEVPSTFPVGLNEAMTKQPTIVINSPDSAPNTNGSVEDVTASQTEALI